MDRLNVDSSEAHFFLLYLFYYFSFFTFCAFFSPMARLLHLFDDLIDKGNVVICFCFPLFLLLVRVARWLAA